MLAKLLSASSGGGGAVTSDDVFISYLRIGTGADATVTTGIDMTKGYTLWSKSRSAATDHAVYNSARGVTYDLVTNSSTGETVQTTGLKSVSSTGHTIGSLAKMNTLNTTYVDWVFRNADKFHNNAVVTKSSGSNATVSFPNLGALGMVRVKRTDLAGSWYVWHSSLSAGQLLIGETTAAATTLGQITVSGTTITLVNGVIADGTYLVEAFAHDPSADGIIQCGSFTTDASGNATVTTGWEPQYLNLKSSSASGNWRVLDVMRGFDASASANQELRPNKADAEQATGPVALVNATGFSVTGLNLSTTFIYLTIRRPNKPPTSGTQVYNAIARTGTGAAATVSGVGFTPDASFTKILTSSYGTQAFDRLRGQNRLQTHDTGAESSDAQYPLFDVMDGFRLGTNALTNGSGSNYINWFFRRAPGVMDVVCYTGTGVARTVPHGLQAVPELMIVKGRDLADSWPVYNGPRGNTKFLSLQTNYAEGTDSRFWNNTTPTESSFTVGIESSVNAAGYKYVAYLFASLPGISKVGSFTKVAGSALNVDCGFTTGARFVLLKRTDAAGDWYVADTVRGLVAAADPYLLLNSTAAEVTTLDWIDPYAAGFSIPDGGLANGSYIYFSVS